MIQGIPQSTPQRIIPHQAHVLAPRRIGLHPLDAAAGTHGARGGAYKVLYTDSNGYVQEVALGADGTVLTSTGAASAPAFEAVSTGTFKYKTADETVTNSTTLQDDNHLLVAVAASEVWLFEYVLFFTQAVDTAGFKMTFTCPSSPTLLRFGGHGAEIATASNLATLVNLKYVSASGSTLSYGSNAGEVSTVIGGGILQNGANAGNLTLQWAQNTASGSTLTLYQGSWLKAWKAA